MKHTHTLFSCAALFALFFFNLTSAFRSPLPDDVPDVHSRTPRIARADPDIEKIVQRRVETIVGQITTGAQRIPDWLKTLDSTGKWPASEVDLTSGCEARRANWPAANHWTRISTMSAAWRGGLTNASEGFVRDTAIRASISSAMGYWFSRDIVNDDCLDKGNTTKCPCADPKDTLWNTNWFSNVILIPKVVSETCLLLDGSLTTQELAKCTEIGKRSYGTFNTRRNAGWQTGANAIDIARIGMTTALLIRDSALLAESVKRIQAEVSIHNKIQDDGIRADGTFGQHDGIIYNGNYGRDFLKGMIDLETEVVGTPYVADATQRSALETLINADRWMVFRNRITNILHWDPSVFSRFLVFPASDPQPTRDTGLNFTRIGDLGAIWDSEPLKAFAAAFERKTDHANAGDLIGNRMFFNNDYMVHRGPNFVSTLRLWSSRTKATECVNSANPLGFHLGSGINYNHIQGTEYEDVPGVWDWNLIPGLTVDYGVTPLTCENTSLNGSEAFVGGVSNGQIGTAAMRFTNPLTKSLQWQKTWFYLPGNIIHVMVAGLSSKSTAPIYSVLDQRHHSGSIFFNHAGVHGGDLINSNYSTYQALWHGNIGYKFPKNNGGATLAIQTSNRTGDWQAIGTSLKSNSTFNIFTSYLIHDPKALNNPIAYVVFPGTQRKEFQKKSKALRLHTVQNDAEISAVYHEDSDITSIVFWNPTGGSVSLPKNSGYKRGKHGSTIVITADKNVALIYDLGQGKITVSDPSQSVASVRVVIQNPPGEGQEATRTLMIDLPQEGLAGQSVLKDV